MRVIINDKEFVFPSSLSEITLGQRINFQQEHGDVLDKMLDSILAMDDGIEKELELTEFHFEKMFRTFTFFTGIPLDVVKESEFVERVAGIYNSCSSALFDEESSIEPRDEYLFEKQWWVISSPELKHGDTLSFGEFIDSKQRIKDMIDLGNSKWEQMLPLCAIYLRKKGEDYQEEFLYEGSKRLDLMKKLPMDIAMQVGFFLSALMNISINTSLFSINHESKASVSI